MFCKKCGNEMPGYATRCDKCGTMVEGASTAKRGFNKLLFIPIGAGAAAVIAIIVALIFVLRPKDDIVPPSDSSARTSSSSSSQTPAIIDNTSSTTPASTPSSSAAESNSQPNESEATIPDSLSFKVSGVNIPVSGGGYVEDEDADDINNEIVIWGENSEYVAMAMINVPQSFIGTNVTYTGVQGNTDYPLAAALFVYNKETAELVSGMPGDGLSDQVIKIDSYSDHTFIKLSVSGNLDSKTWMPFGISGGFYRFTDYDDINYLLNKYYEALDKAMHPADDPAQDPVDEVVIAGQSYPLDASYIDLTGKNVTNADIENLKYLTNLTNIHLANNSRVTDLSALSGLTKLETLWLDDTGISDLSPLSGCKNLREMGIKNTKVKDISVLSNFTKLEKFVAVNCNISDISPVAKCPRMYEIWLSYNPITDFSPLVKLNNLETVGLDNCCVMTWDILETLYGLTFADTLHLGGNGITDEMAEALSNNLYSPDGSGQWYC